MPIFTTPEPISVAIELVVGDVRITAGDRAHTVVEVGPSDGPASRTGVPPSRPASNTRPADCSSRRRSNAVLACSARSDRST
jgi:hypothetical protein